MLTRYPNKMMGKAKRCRLCGGKGIILVHSGERFCNRPILGPEPCPWCNGTSSQLIEHKDVNDAPDGTGN